MLDVIGHKGNANKQLRETPLQAYKEAIIKKTVTSAMEDMENWSPRLLPVEMGGGDGWPCGHFQECGSA